MKIEKLHDEIFRITEFLDKERFDFLYQKICGLEYDHRDNGKSFKCDVMIAREGNNKQFLDVIFPWISKELTVLKKLSEKFIWEELLLNSYWWAMRMKQNFYVGRHVDAHSNVQWVIHFSNEDSKTYGWVLKIYDQNDKETIIYPVRNSVVLFKGTFWHEVSEYTLGDTDRYSMSFGFSIRERSDQNKKIFHDIVGADLDNM